MINKMTTKFMFLRDAKRNPVACIATNFDKETNKFTYQYSVVHSDDQFDKERGRQIAEGRLRSNPILLVDSEDADQQYAGSVGSVLSKPSPSVSSILKKSYFQDNHICPKLPEKSNMESIVRNLINSSSPTKLKNAAKLWIDHKEKTRFGIE